MDSVKVKCIEGQSHFGFALFSHLLPFTIIEPTFYIRFYKL